MSGLLVEPLLRALSSGPHALRMAHAAAALGAVLAEAQAGDGVPAVVAMAQRCLAALLCMGRHKQQRYPHSTNNPYDMISSP
jgi:hypothetical protein